MFLPKYQSTDASQSELDDDPTELQTLFSDHNSGDEHSGGKIQRKEQLTKEEIKNRMPWVNHKSTYRASKVSLWDI